MTTPLIMLGLLIAPLLVSGLGSVLTGRRWLEPRTAACLGITLVFCFTGLGHFVQTEPMAAMLPPWVPERNMLVYLSGILEFVLAAAVLVPRWRRAAGLVLIVMLIAFLPVNIYAAVNRVGMGGHEWGPIYLLIRVPLQFILIGWIWWFAVRSREHQPRQDQPL